MVRGSTEPNLRRGRTVRLILASAAVAALAVALLLSVFRIASLNDRIDRLERQLAALEAQLAVQPTPTPTEVPPTAFPDATVPPEEDPDVTRSPADLPTEPPLPTGVPTSPPPALAYLPDFRQPPPTFAAPIGKVAYLTFDDGPSDRTPEVLDVLDRYHLHAAFFVVNRNGAKYEEYLRRIVAQGSVVAMHSASHDYTRIYASTRAFVEDLARNHAYILAATGVPPAFYRFPGGSLNAYNTTTSAAIRREMDLRGFHYYDWNSSAGDGSHAVQDPAAIAANVLRTTKGRSRVVVLCHDAIDRQGTVAALPAIIEGLYAQGYRIDLLTADVLPVVFTIG